MGRLQSAYTGSSARAHVGLGSSWLSDGPYAQQDNIYDIWGNTLSRTGWGGTNPQYGAGYTDNKMIGMVYDATGSLTDAGGGWTFTYDVTGQQATSAMGNVQMFYDGDRLRGKKSENNVVTYYLRSSVLGGQVVAELTSAGAWSRGYVYLGGEVLAVQQTGVYWMHQDPVAKSKRITDTSGNVVSTIELDPWGGETNRSSNEAFQPRKFTTYGRDSIGSDDAMHRRYNRWWARFEQADPYDGSYSLTDPQSLNRFSYVQNDPVSFVDPNGLLADNIWPPCTPGNSSAYCGVVGFGGWGGGFNMNDQQSFLNPSGRQIIRNRTFTLSFHDEETDTVYFWTWFPMLEQLLTSRQPYTTADMLREFMKNPGSSTAKPVVTPMAPRTLVNPQPLNIGLNFCLGGRPGFGFTGCVGCIFDGEGMKPTSSVNYGLGLPVSASISGGRGNTRPGTYATGTAVFPIIGVSGQAQVTHPIANRSGSFVFGIPEANVGIQRVGPPLSGTTDYDRRNLHADYSPGHGSWCGIGRRW